MLYGKKIVCIIPARLASSRFPRKVIAPIAGKPMIQHVWEAARKIPFFDEVIIALDSDITAEVVRSFGGTSVMTPEYCPSGTLRLISAIQAENLQGDVWVNWQADEPLVHSAMIETLLQSSMHAGNHIWTLKKKITDTNQINSPHFAKLVCDAAGRALYFSRSPIPYFRGDQNVIPTYFKHVGLYAYTTKALQFISQLPSSMLENAEALEQLRWLEHGMSITVHETNHDVIGVDLPGDVQKVEQAIKQQAMAYATGAA